MKQIIYSEHLLFRLELRLIPPELPRTIYQESQEKYIDTETGLLVAVHHAQHQGKTRELAVVFTEDERLVKLITVHPLKPNQKLHRTLSGRWKKI